MSRCAATRRSNTRFRSRAGIRTTTSAGCVWSGEAIGAHVVAPPDWRPRAEQLDSRVPAAQVELDPAILDRIDEIVQPGVNLNPADTSYREQALKPPLRRR